MKKRSIFALGLVAFVASACDSGDIRESEIQFDHSGLTAQLTGHIAGLSQWPEEYDVVLAAFDGESNYSIVQKHIEAGATQVVLSNISPEATSLEFCVVDRLRERVATFRKMDITDEMRSQECDTLRFDVGRFDAGMFSTIKQVVFVDQGECTRCHREPSRAAGKLSLLPELAYEQLVGRPSSVEPSQQRVVAGRADESWLMRVLTPGNEKLTHYADHPNILNNEQDQKYLKLLRGWIDAGARE